MDTSLVYMFFHLIGFGLIMTLMESGWLLHMQYVKAPDFKTKLIVLSSARAVGLLSPIAIALMLLTGVANMHTRALGLFTESWLAIKILLFVIASANGVVFGIRSRKRGMLVAQLAQGSAPAGSEVKLVAMDKAALAFHIVQSVLLIAILILTVWKPGRFGA